MLARADARKAGKKGQNSEESGAGQEAAAKTDRTNKKAEVIAMMNRAKGATLLEIIKAIGWQAHTVRGFVSILGSKGGEKIKSSKRRLRPRANCGVPASRRTSDVTDPSHHCQ